jgi:hypothetical protein
MTDTEQSIEERLKQMYELAADILGLDPEYVASPKTVAAIRVYLKLYSLNSGNLHEIREWLNQDNETLGGKPIEMVNTEEGLNSILEHLTET